MTKGQAGAETPSDEALMQAYQQGDSQAFEVLYRRHSARVYGYLMERLKDRALADDVFQQTFAKLHRSRMRYDASFPFLPWLFTVCKSTLMDSFRENSRVQKLQAEYASAAMAQGALAEAPEAVHPTLDLESLNPEQRRAVELRYGEGLDFERIAHALETSPANARQIVSRAVRKLRLVFQKGGTAT